MVNRRNVPELPLRAMKVLNTIELEALRRSELPAE